MKFGGGKRNRRISFAGERRKMNGAGRRRGRRAALPAKIAFVLLGLCLAGGAALLGINAYVKYRTRPYLLSAAQACELPQADCILVPGCLVRNGNEPSLMLRDRLSRAMELYHGGAAPKLLMSGDHGREDYNEVAVMKEIAVREGAAPEDVFMDHAGFSTYESMYRARDVFAAKSVIIVTQEYHLYRALYIARALGLEAYGVPAESVTYGGQLYRECREILARNKDFLMTILKPEPTYLGEVIPVSGDGNATND